MAARSIVSNRAGIQRTCSCSQPSMMPTEPFCVPRVVGAQVCSFAPRLAICDRLDSFTFRILLCRRLRLPFPLTKHICRCGRRSDFYGHHRAAPAQSGVLARRGFAVESVVARVCREGGARVSTNIMVRVMDLVPNPQPDRSPR